MKKTLLILATLCCGNLLWSQDIITLKSGEEVKAVVQEIGADYVKYKKFENKNGPTYTMQKSAVFMIKYENGTKDVFEKSSTAATPATPARSQTATPTARPPQQPAVSKANPPASQQPKQSSSKVRFGLEAGLTVSNINSDFYKPGGALEDYEIYPRFGFTCGMLVDFRVAKVFSIQPEMLILRKGYKEESYTDLFYVETGKLRYEDAFEERDLFLLYFEFPLNFILNIPIAKDRLQIGAGPYAAYGVSGVCESHFTYKGKDIDEEMVDADKKYKLFSGERKEFKPFDWGANFFIGYAFNDVFFLKVKHGMGIGNISIYDTKEKNTYWSFSLGVKF